MTKAFSLAMIAVLLLIATLCQAAEPHGWRGDGSGEYPTANPPTEWTADKNVVWTTPLAKWSNASPIMVGDKLFICAEPNSLLCLSATDGKILWEKTNGAADLATPAEQAMKLPGSHKDMGSSTQTPVSDGVNVWALYASGVATCFTLDGVRVWTKQLRAPAPSAWGFDASPVLVDGKLIIVYGDVYAYNPLTGEQLWQAKSLQHWGSPVVTSIGGVNVLVTTNGEIIRISDGVILAKGLFKPEYNAPVVHDSVIYSVEKGQNAEKAIAWQLPAKIENDAVTPTKLWEAAIPANRYYASPVYSNGTLYLMAQSGQFTALDAKTGTDLNKWPGRLPNMGGELYYPSLAAAGKYLYVSNESTMLVIDTTTNTEIARNPIPGKFRSTPIFVGERMYVRGKTTMYCIGK